MEFSQVHSFFFESFSLSGLRPSNFILAWEERIGTHTRSLLFPRTSQVFEAEGELDSHSLAGKKRVDQATTEAEDRSQDG